MSKLVVPVISLLLILLAACGTSNSNAEDQLSERNTGSLPTGDLDQSQHSVEESEYDSDQVEAWLSNLEMTTDIEVQDGSIQFNMELVNQGEEELELMFSSGQQYEIVVTNEAGEKLYQYSEGMMFTEALVTETLASGDSMSWSEAWNYAEDTELKAGTYKAEITLLPAQINNQVIENNPFTKSDTFEIAEEAAAGLPKAKEDTDGVMFRNVEVEGESGVYTVTGEVNPSVGDFYYNVEDGHVILVEETKIESSSTEWSSFTIEIEIEESQLPVHGGTLTLFLYKKNLEDDQILASVAYPLEVFN